MPDECGGCRMSTSYARGMEGSIGAPPQRVCPQCARISWATGPRCPYCTERFSLSRRVTPWMLVGAAAGVLVGVAIMFFIFGQIIEGRVNDRIDEINQNFETDLNNFRNDEKTPCDCPPPKKVGLCWRSRVRATCRARVGLCNNLICVPQKFASGCAFTTKSVVFKTFF